MTTSQEASRRHTQRQDHHNADATCSSKVLFRGSLVASSCRGIYAIAAALISALMSLPAHSGEVLRFDAPAEQAEKEQNQEQNKGEQTQQQGIEGAAQGPSAEESAWRFSLEDGLIDSSVLVSSNPPVDATSYARGTISAARPLGDKWDLRLGARLYGHLQGGGQYADQGTGELGYAENWLRYRSANWQITAGTQRIAWGRVDEIAPTDRLASEDLTRFTLSTASERRRANPALRLEGFRGPWKLDAVALLGFRTAELPDEESIWHPVDRRTGRVAGLDTQTAVPTPLTTLQLTELVRRARLRKDPAQDSGGGGVRINRYGRDIDFALTAQRVRHSAPYFRIKQRGLAKVEKYLAGGTTELPNVVFTAEYPQTWVTGADMAFVTGGWTWRMEAAWLSDVPTTRTEDFAYRKSERFDWVIGTEGFPTPRPDLRLTVQLAGEHLLAQEELLEPEDTYYITGEIEDFFRRDEWRASLRFSTGLNRHDTYLNPEIAWIAAEPHEYFIGAHWMDGDTDTLGGFYHDRSLIITGWRGEL